MNRHPVGKWHDLVEARDPSRLPSLLADDVVFFSPVVHTPQRGRAITAAYLGAALQVFCNPGFRYVREIVEFKVMLRPLKAVSLIHERMGAMLAAARRPT